MTIKTSTATVYFGGRRRWLSLKTAARREAIEAVSRRYPCQCEQMEYDPGGNPVYPGLNCDNHSGHPVYDKMVRRLARVHAAAAQRDQPVPAPTAPEARALAACRELAAAAGEVKRLKQVIGDGLQACFAAWAEAHPGEITGRPHETHLATAYAFEVEEETQYTSGRRVYLESVEQAELLAACPHCLAAHNAIQERKAARRRLGAARRAVTMIGRPS